MADETPEERFNEATREVLPFVFVWLREDEIVLDGHFTFDEFTRISLAWIQYLDDTQYREPSTERLTP